MNCLDVLILFYINFGSYIILFWFYSDLILEINYQTKITGQVFALGCDELKNCIFVG